MDDDPHQTLFGLLRNLFKKKHPFQSGSDLTHEIQDLMDEGQAMGFISDEESHMVYGVLDLKDTKANSIMVPRTEVSSIPIDSTLVEVIKLVAECGHTRIPVFKDNMDDVLGILHAKDLLKLWGQNTDSRIPQDILRKPFFVPGNQKVSELLKELKEKKTHLAIVTDEYGGTAGIITIEDILEEIVGEIMDEHDRELPLLSVLDDKSVMVDARLDIEKLEEHLDMELPEGSFESVGGFIIYLLGRVPKKDEKVYFKDLEMTVQSADERRIGKILITRNTLHAPLPEN